MFTVIGYQSRNYTENDDNDDDDNDRAQNNSRSMAGQDDRSKQVLT